MENANIYFKKINKNSYESNSLSVSPFVRKFVCRLGCVAAVTKGVTINEPRLLVSVKIWTHAVALYC